jgi:hypothetical protein
MYILYIQIQLKKMNEDFQNYQSHGEEKMEIDDGSRKRPMLIRKDRGTTDMDIEWVKVTVTEYGSHNIHLPEKTITKTRFFALMNELNRVRELKDMHSSFRNQEHFYGGFILYTMYVTDLNNNHFFSKDLNEDEYNIVIRFINFETTSNGIGGKRSIHTSKKFWI